MWSLHHPGGSAWLVGLVPRLTVIEPKGSLIGDFAATRVVYDLPGVGELRLDAPRWHALAAGRGSGGRWLHLVIGTLHADRAVWTPHVSTTPSEPATLPQSLRLPIEIEVGAASVDELRIGGAEAMPVRNVRARVHLGADGGARHRIDALAAGIEFGDARGAFAIGADAPFRVDATVDATATAKGWSATARASGPLEALDTVATVRAAATATHPAQSLDARALIRPLAAWPLGALDASVSALDLSAFTSALPTTALTGEARATTSGIDAPALRLARRSPTRARAAGTKACCRCAAFAPSCAPARTIPASSTCRSCRPSSARRPAPPAASSAGAAGRDRTGTSTSSCARSSQRPSTRVRAAPW